MGKNNNKNKKNSKNFPLVSVCTPTFNRRPFIETMFECFRNQDYPKSRIEWIIVDDGTDKIEDLIEKSNIPQIRYFKVDKKMFLGAKRNYMHKYATGSIIVYMDDDDYYPPERISHAVERLQSDPVALCAGNSEIYVYFKTLSKMIQCGPYHGTHATAGTFAFKKQLLEQTQYEEGAAIAEERAFLKGYTIPFIQLDPLKSILVFSHDHNTFDKRRMFDNPDPTYFKESDKTVDTFIRKESEKNIKDFFMRDIDGLLEKYKLGLPNMKPDVLKQIKEIEDERAETHKKEIEKRKQNGPIMLQQEGQPPRPLTSEEVVKLMHQQQAQIKQLNEQINSANNNNNQMQKIINMLQNQLVEKGEQLIQSNTTIKDLQKIKQDENVTRIPIEEVA
tara:strand:- start:3303 stop:4472 length:1170 start_codon:yes stop_codon:yes gene_type:complete